MRIYKLHEALYHKHMQQTFTRIKEQLLQQGFTIIQHDFLRPWGGFFVIEPKEAPKFIETYFPRELWNDLQSNLNVRPKILMVAPNKRLSWQYHKRRSEIWNVVEGPIGVVESASDIQGDMNIYTTNETITLAQGQRHRLVGLNTVGIVAEIWQHTDTSNPSDEDDIIRLEDDFGR